jgi:glutamyl/glutaminyl-tRNA synthetase
MVCQFNKTRLAPTPSGYLHVGNVLSFSITAAMAKKCDAKILLRIDDLDQARADSRYVRDIFETLHFLDIPWDEGPRNEKDFSESYVQFHRLGLYNAALAQLAEQKMVFACTCSRKQLLARGTCLCKDKHIPLDAENTSWRLVTGDKQELAVKNYDNTQIQSFLPGEMHDFVVRKKDGYPAYQLASVVDDLFYGVDLVVRGEDLWPSTLAQQALAAALGMDQFKNTAFLHHPLLVEPSGNKMSKSAGAASIKYLRESGKSKAEVFGLISALLGFNKTIENWQQLAGVVMPDQF